MEFLYEYGLFLAKAITIVAAILLVVGGVFAAAQKQKPKKGELQITNLSEKLDEVKSHFSHMILDQQQIKNLDKEEKKRLKAEKKASKNKLAEDDKARLFVVDFKGSMDAHEVDALREEITAILSVVNKEKDEILVRLESPGGMVHGYGLAASQLQRIREKGIPLTVAVDKVAASGGYMMACVANKIISAPFAIIGSIGVVAQLPNFNKVLKKYDVDFEQHTAGEFKRTLTLFGENTDAAREKFREEIQETHELFKDFVGKNRESLDIGKVATGEHWYGQQALDLGLVDKIQTSDDYLLEANDDAEIFAVKYSVKKNIAEKFGISMATSFKRFVENTVQSSSITNK